MIMGPSSVERMKEQMRIEESETSLAAVGRELTSGPRGFSSWPRPIPPRLSASISANFSAIRADLLVRARCGSDVLDLRTECRPDEE